MKDINFLLALISNLLALTSFTLSRSRDSKEKTGNYLTYKIWELHFSYDATSLLGLWKSDMLQVLKLDLYHRVESAPYVFYSFQLVPVQILREIFIRTKELSKEAKYDS
jgi:hypothetical protein